MYLTQLGIACFAVLVAGCHSSPAERAADDIRSVVSSDWRLTVSNNVIRIQSKRRDVKLVHRFSRNAMMSFEQLAKTYKPTNYQVTLTFVPRLSDAELKRLRDERHQRKWELDHFGDRRPASNDLQTPYAVRMEYNDAIVRWDEARVPSFYNDTHSIFVDRSMDMYYEIYPLDAEAQVQQLMASLAKAFQEYR